MLPEIWGGEIGGGVIAAPNLVGVLIANLPGATQTWTPATRPWAFQCFGTRGNSTY